MGSTQAGRPGESAANPGGADSAAPRDLRDMLARGRSFLQRQGLNEWRLEAEILVAHAVGLKRLELFLQLDRPVLPAELERGRELLVKRARRVPCAYLVGSREFYNLEFQVGPEVLIPRPESEQLVDLARERLRARLTPGRAPRIFDLCTGSGNLIVALGKHVPGAELMASDVSPAALEVAAANAQRHGVNVRFLAGDGWSALPAGTPGFDVILSNPPYIDPAAAAGLPADVREHEPAAALFAPAGQPDFWAHEILRGAATQLLPGGSVLIELGFDQAERLAKELSGNSYAFHRDLEGHQRVLEWRRPE